MRAWLKKHAAIITVCLSVAGLTLSVFGLWYTYSRDQEQSRTVFAANCYVIPEGKVGLAIGDGYPSLQIETRCALRNLGLRSADLVEVRTGLTRNGKLSHIPSAHIPPSRWENIWNLEVNGGAFTKPQTIPPGSQATVTVMLGYPLVGHALKGNGHTQRIKDALVKCNEQAPLKTHAALDSCLHGKKLLWTDIFEMVAGVEETDFYNGMAGVFLLSTGTYVYDEISFRYGWVWHISCQEGVERLPHYMKESFDTTCINYKPPELAARESNNK